MKLINGKEISKKTKDAIKAEIEEIRKTGKRVPKLAVILVGDNPASQVYVRNKEKACAYVGMESLRINKDATLSEEELLKLIDELNHDDGVDGILVQLPLPKTIDEEKVLKAIAPEKDVDGFHPANIAKLFLNEEGFIPCTPYGMMVMLEEIGYDLDGKEVVVVGRSNIVGKPVALLALHHNATVTIAHSHTKNLQEVTSRADVLIAAIGKAKFFTADYVKEGAVVLDVGMNRDENGKLCGDVDFDDVKEKVSAITPVPGGVGPMTIAMLMKNTLLSYKRRVQ
ncbi:bifunctional methylenetetrahydrofolate dehydrogenase/methenyltetrahydrofolate cyclohydrolase FolD [Sharpea azabuensis]|uniref:bifunctional methylenetetrahydrofolate dehydrogenase/methenyltetrahydrofolate cyclohydrolase FolD n=1 Tax=Sharpea azabuensis TaxID=322505 RepID=UPI0008F3A8E1|nr:bifunctional methylenetetrahydrofolate dehydrogenase/methenyltetrahydrofolate cyclohydrolase FolD [Sharpea azabuensis]HAJ14808.1 bifunctional methylenetetrahydrofolate dehydrogenase/methenyltetrahydrofolate cyclohydrolase FolD [Erysipelotrichaceae bacterium]MDD6513031.1 bifunctional methylenetetrahydrofolate dehydrogenase/methenyltetrahydrofolate cyclohydrolase FolD [Sharpea azabuensis]MEE3308974.1 bifunctional methylenetetrahydrofolate dehydrogenase/methenyltetrahydrofolate cyclohydrolase Fo